MNGMIRIAATIALTIGAASTAVRAADDEQETPIEPLISRGCPPALTRTFAKHPGHALYCLKRQALSSDGPVQIEVPILGGAVDTDVPTQCDVVLDRIGEPTGCTARRVFESGDTLRLERRMGRLHLIHRSRTRGYIDAALTPVKDGEVVTHWTVRVTGEPPVEAYDYYVYLRAEDGNAGRRRKILRIEAFEFPNPSQTCGNERPEKALRRASGDSCAPQPKNLVVHDTKEADTGGGHEPPREN